MSDQLNGFKFSSPGVFVLLDVVAYEAIHLMKDASLSLHKKCRNVNYGQL